jgi:hypothetical protein
VLGPDDVVLVLGPDSVALEDPADDADDTDCDCAEEDPQAHTSTAASAGVSREKPIPGA